jgi:hypothetical protein
MAIAIANCFQNPQPDDDGVPALNTRFTPRRCEPPDDPADMRIQCQSKNSIETL